MNIEISDSYLIKGMGISIFSIILVVILFEIVYEGESMEFDINKLMSQHLYRRLLCDSFTAVELTAPAEVLIWSRDAEQASTQILFQIVYASRLQPAHPQLSLQSMKRNWHCKD